MAAHTYVHSLYRRCMRVAAACVPEQRSFSLTYVRTRFRDHPFVEPGSHMFEELMRDGNEECNRMAAALLSKGLLDHSTADSLTRESPFQIAVRRATSECLSSWDEADVCHWLQSLGLEQHRSAFMENRVNGRLLLRLDHEDLEELNVSSRLQRKLILTRRDELLS